MKKVIISNYIQGLASFLDSKNLYWEKVHEVNGKLIDPDKEDIISFSVSSDEELFKLGFEFGKFYSKND